MRSDAHISGCGLYRYCLSRVWDDALPAVCWILLNPSTADAARDDPTIRRCVGFAKAWGAGGIYVVNLFAYRATDPCILPTVADPVGPHNDWIIRRNAECGRLAVVAGWGVNGGLMGRGRVVLAMLRDHGVRVQCLGTTGGGHPRHPLYVKGDQALVPLEVDHASIN